VRYLLILTMVLVLTSCSQKKVEKLRGFSYTPSGKLVPSKSGKGRIGDNYIYAPGIRFPIERAPAYINSQVYGVGGYLGPKGSLCSPKNYQYPWHDNYCEKRGWKMPLCLGGKGHQGDDIRTATCEKKKYYTVAVEDGVISSIGKYTVSLRGKSGRTYRYLHQDPRSLMVHRGERVKRGQRLGLVSNYMGSTPTSIHLHFDMRQTIKIGNKSKSVFVPPYSSLVEAYKRLLRGNP